MIDISNIDKAVLVAALFNNSKPLGLGFFAPQNNTKMTPEAAQAHIDNQGMSFDYLEGRVMKIDVSGDTLNSWGYNRDNGNGAAEKIVLAIRNQQALDFNVSTPKTELEIAAAAGDEEKAINLANKGMTIGKF